jgi:hypothetical protein
MRVRLGTKGSFILPTSLVDLAATAVRILMQHALARIDVGA